ncbi:hypothetical protein PMAYCL1PPCAC_22243 [Pristionchus mayeri]|uniref:Uncharacterized protein n=1 Tax=Pristionchus mayeri TaxID=1317129 RepID=A0AAN5I4M8_9BILA|nr:hypothetical protein PMAYCL1PPCAC_22243 [Pristionchus mayeri]
MKLILLSFLFLQISYSLECYEKLDLVDETSNCTGDACVTRFQFGFSVDPMIFQGCISNADANFGCFEGPMNTLCVCLDDFCNVDKYGIAPITPLNSSTCPAPESSGCDNTTCLFTTDKDMKNTCLSFGEPVTLHELFINTIMIDQTSVLKNKKKIVDKSMGFGKVRQ